MTPRFPPPGSDDELVMVSGVDLGLSPADLAEFERIAENNAQALAAMRRGEPVGIERVPWFERVLGSTEPHLRALEDER